MLREKPSAVLGLTVGALFGIATHHAIASSGVSLDGVLWGLPVSAFGQFRPAVAWWAWVLLPPTAFVLGRAGVRIAHAVGQRQAEVGLPGLAASAGVVLLLAWIGHLPSSPAAAGPNALASVLFIGISALLTALGQRFGAFETRAFTSAVEPRRTAPGLWQRGGRGSIHPSLAPAEELATAPAFRAAPHPALAFARMAAVVIAMVLGACGGAVLVLGARAQRGEVAATGNVPGSVSSPAGQSRRPGDADQTPTGDADRVEPAAGEAGKLGVPELTFTTGYAARQTARAAAAAARWIEAASGSRPDATVRNLRVKKRPHRAAEPPARRLTVRASAKVRKSVQAAAPSSRARKAYLESRAPPTSAARHRVCATPRDRSRPHCLSPAGQ